MEDKAQLKPLYGVYNWLRIFFLMYIVGEIAVGIGCFLMLTMGSEMFGPGEPYSMGDIIYAVGGFALFLGFFISVIFFCVYSFRAAKNLKILNAAHMDTSPGWAAGWYFVPIANLWKPFGVMEQIWEATDSLVGASEVRPNTMVFWWICWLLTNFSSNASFRMSMRAGYMNDYASDVSLYKTTLYIDIFSAVTGIIAAWLILEILSKITERQDQYIQTLAFD